ncbi:MAG: bifunctional UDP-N-acetylglucosamine diphosphorylase/glucosamine-1-phosphate N-acetyltransferase GlmU [Pseudomonadota bacterium]|nr:bifunctional UDP-N-acetylglucosamine diphosphorylase/glucosamine-1-phosphate N-acetyltransferase GlmU [Pseudomonadota bacterium]
MRLEVIVLAAGEGTRMQSSIPKVLHVVGGRPLLEHVLNVASDLSPDTLNVVIGHGGAEVKARIEAPDVAWVDQAERKGTGHAVIQAMDNVDPSATVLVLYGDVPLIEKTTLEQCIAAASDGIGIVTVEMSDPKGLGRILRGADGRISAIIEEQDATEQQRTIKEVNTGILAASSATLAPLLASIETHNSQGEYYLTDVISRAASSGIQVTGVGAICPEEVQGINDHIQLAAVERHFQRREAERLMVSGVTLADPARLDLRGTLTAGRDCFIDINVVIEGTVAIGDNVSIGPGCVVTDSELANGVVVEAHSVVEGAIVGSHCRLGPFARVRPGTELAEGARIGNFVETKKAIIGAGTKANHLAYLGDSTIGAECNIGAGTVTCNYDGVDKNETHIGDGVFVGTNSTLVAPLTIDEGAYVAAGSTITSKVDSEDLAVGRARQRNIQGWVPPTKRK